MSMHAWPPFCHEGWSLGRSRLRWFGSVEVKDEGEMTVSKGVAPHVVNVMCFMISDFSTVGLRFLFKNQRKADQSKPNRPLTATRIKANDKPLQKPTKQRMAQVARRNLRMQKELKLLLTDPPPGASFPLLSPDSGFSSLSSIEAQIEGPEGTVYAKGIFKIKIQIPERYPFQPPNVTFVTPIYHPNIDTGGRICLDILNLPPKGAWQPSLNISTVLTSIGLLLSEPNPDDGLMCEASREYKYNRQVFEQKARAMTEKYSNAGASGRNFSTQMEFKGSEKESKHEINDLVSNHENSSGITSKLSLVFSGSSHKRDSDGEVNDVSNYKPVDLENHIEAEGETEESKGVPDKYKLRHQNSCGSRWKLSLQSTVQFYKNDAHNMEGVESKQSHHDSTLTFGSKSEDSKLVCQVRQEMSSSLDSCQVNYDDKKMLVIPENLPSQSRLSLAPGPSPMLMSINHDKLQHCSDSVDGIEKGSSITSCKKICLVSKKLSLGFKGSSQVEEEDYKENVVPTPKLPFSNTQTKRKSGMGHKLSLGPLIQLQESTEGIGQMFLHSQNLSTDWSQKQQFNLHQNSEIAEGEKRPGEESHATESVIVLDSEDSEEENNGSMRSKSSLVRKPTTKRKAQSLVDEYPLDLSF